MGFVERELESIRVALPGADAPLRDLLMAAQQALSWALEPSLYAAPTGAITGTREDSAAPQTNQS
jgi:hypothetical protein